jgi:hypothetical protein
MTSAGFDHPGDQGGGEKEWRLDVDREDSVEGFLVGCERAVGWVDACVVDQDGDGSERCSRIGSELRGPCRGPFEVGSHEGGMPAGGFDEVHHVSPAGRISAGHDHARSLPGHGDGHPSADVAGRSGYQGDLALEAWGHDISWSGRNGCRPDRHCPTFLRWLMVLQGL